MHVSFLALCVFMCVGQSTIFVAFLGGCSSFLLAFFFFWIVSHVTLNLLHSQGRFSTSGLPVSTSVMMGSQMHAKQGRLAAQDAQEPNFSASSTLGLQVHAITPSFVCVGSGH